MSEFEIVLQKRSNYCKILVKFKRREESLYYSIVIYVYHCTCYVCYLCLNFFIETKLRKKQKKNKQLPFPSQLNLTFLIEDELGIIISPSIPFQNFLPNKKKYINENYAKHLKTRVTINFQSFKRRL